MTRRVLSAEINHETNTFSVLPTTLESYRTRLYYRDAEIARAMAGTACEIAAHIDAAARHGWRLVQPIATRATPSGKTTAKAWATTATSSNTGATPMTHALEFPCSWCIPTGPRSA